MTPEHLTSQQEALDWFAAEHRVLLSMISSAYDTRFDTQAWQLGWAIAEFLDRRGHWNDYAATQRIALAAASRLGDVAGQAMTRRLLATACARLADYDQAREHLAACLTLYRQCGDQAGEARGWRLLGWVAEHQDNYPEALG